MGSKCGLNNNSLLELRTGLLSCHTLVSMLKKCMKNEMACPQLSARIVKIYEGILLLVENQGDQFVIAAFLKNRD